MAPPHDARKFLRETAPRCSIFSAFDEFVTKLVLAAADISLGREHAHRIVRQRVAAVIGFPAPDRKDDR